MAHYAQISTDPVSNTMYVSMVIVVPEAEIIDESGVETDAMGCRYINEHLGIDGVWIQASYTGRIRGVYPGIGFRYDPVADVFVPPDPEAVP